MPNVGDVVHYVVSHNGPARPDGAQERPSVCRAAIVTAVPAPDDDLRTLASLAVLSPGGVHFHARVGYWHPRGPFQPGTWHHTSHSRAGTPAAHACQGAAE